MVKPEKPGPLDDDNPELTPARRAELKAKFAKRRYLSEKPGPALDAAEESAFEHLAKVMEAEARKKGRD
jgi:hypothetical protein